MRMGIMAGAYGKSRVEELFSRRVRILYRSCETGTLVVMIAVFVYIVVFSSVTVMKHYAFLTTGWDLGIYMQVLWSTLHGRPFYYSYELNKIPSGNFFGLHFVPILFLILPLYMLFPCAETLLVIQTVAIGAGAVPLYFLAKEVLESRTSAVVVSVIYLLYPPLHGLNWFDFHPEAFIPLFIILMAYFFEMRKFRWMYVSMVLALSTIEFTALIVAAIGVSFLLKGLRKGKDWVHGIVVAVASAIWFLLSVKVSNILAGDVGARTFAARLWDQWGSTPLEIVVNVITHPVDAFLFMITPWYKVIYPIMLLLPLLFVPLFAPIEFIPALAWIIPALLSRADPHSEIPGMSVYLSIYMQYTGFVTGQIFVAFVYGLRNLKRLQVPRPTDLMIRTLKKILLVSLICAIILSPLGFASGKENLEFPVITERHKYLNDVLALIPGNASVLSQNDLLPHLSNRFEVYGPNLPPGLVPEYILVDVKSRWFVRPPIFYDTVPARMNDTLYRYLRDYPYGLLASVDGIMLFKLGYRGELIKYVPFVQVYDHRSISLQSGYIASDETSESGKVLVHGVGSSSRGFFTLFVNALPPGTYEVRLRLKINGLLSPMDKVMVLALEAENLMSTTLLKEIYGADVAKGIWMSLTMIFRTSTVAFNVKVYISWIRSDIEVRLDTILIRQASPNVLNGAEITHPALKGEASFLFVKSIEGYFAIPWGVVWLESPDILLLGECWREWC